ncbi:MAG: hypothetical protein A2020_15915 [Lentisphaerae bacterium GWF2_45_14]|nr:MAG: hypothetical protein A2020_15915 [Lentisphaerae bacterium GWF2_45_14]
MTSYSCPHCTTDFESEVGADEVIYCPHCNAIVDFPPDEELTPGRRVGGFEIVEFLGRGGMGNVYLATQISMDRPVALKILPKALIVDRPSVEQFMNEVRMTGRMEHPNIVTALDAGEDDGLYYFAMSFVKGEDLEKRIERIGFIPEKTAMKYILQISEALDYALKKHNLIHKDIKPGNIMVNENGEAFLLDMGIAQKIGEGEKKLHIEGSPFFMSPEQTRNETLNWSSDLYSLGATLYNMIVGVPPYDDTDVMNIVRMHSEAPFPPPVSRNRDVEISQQCVRLLQTMMAKSPLDRFASWEEFQKSVKNIIKPKKSASHKKAISTNTTRVIKNIPQKRRSFHDSSSHRVLVIREDKNALLPLIKTLAFFALLAVCAFFGMRYFMDSQAKKGLQEASSYMKHLSYNEADALMLIRLTLRRADGFFVSPSAKAEVLKGCDELKAAIDNKIYLRNTFDSNLNKANEIYSGAFEFLRKRQLSSAKIACDNVMIILEKLEAPTKLDKDKLDMLLESVRTMRSKIDEALSKRDK